MTISVDQGKKLSRLGFVCALLVVMIHWSDMSTWAGKCLYRRDSVAALGRYNGFLAYALTGGRL